MLPTAMLVIYFYLSWLFLFFRFSVTEFCAWVVSAKVCAKKIDFYFVCFGKKVKNNKSLNTHTSLWTGFDKSSVVSAAGAERKKGTKSWKGLFGEGKPPINGCASLLVRVNLSWLKNWAPPTEKRMEETRREEKRSRKNNAERQKLMSAFRRRCCLGFIYAFCLGSEALLFGA